MNVSHHYDIKDDLYDLFLDPKDNILVHILKIKMIHLKQPKIIKFNTFIKTKFKPNQKVLDIDVDGDLY